jgi:type IV pilus assembly protein PilY1
LTPVVTPSPTNGMTFTATSFALAPFTKVVVSSTSGTGTADLNGDGVVDAADKDERTNFANWYSYYRTRMLMMKTATGLAFKPIADNFRVGYSSINNNTNSDYLGLETFNATQKTAW